MSAVAEECFKKTLAPVLTVAGLKHLKEMIETNDPRLRPNAFARVRDGECTVCAIGACLEVETKLNNVYDRVDWIKDMVTIRLTLLDYDRFTSWFDDTKIPLEERKQTVLGWVNDVLAASPKGD